MSTVRAKRSMTYGKRMLAAGDELPLALLAPDQQQRVLRGSDFDFEVVGEISPPPAAEEEAEPKPFVRTTKPRTAAEQHKPPRKSPTRRSGP